MRVKAVVRRRLKGKLLRKTKPLRGKKALLRKKRRPAKELLTHQGGFDKGFDNGYDRGYMDGFHKGFEQGFDHHYSAS
ncbi:hypothetical protein [Paenibacillus planticolens]|uniref:Uncharacterized protein n=1 Tax=Paenibacillus planticolens TaxID=2654976 RepID=A0ABX1ZW10_9BACL|nr:hypothetical protein [Paenibacillus planticolens]NOV04239.1 hypothetical protein [Paenibacillus planticolens]